MTRTRIVIDHIILWVCVDCMLTHANGECGETEFTPLSKLTPEESRELCMGLPWKSTPRLCTPEDRDNGCDCETNTFSRSSCDGCENPYDGERHGMTILVWGEASTV